MPARTPRRLALLMFSATALAATAAAGEKSVPESGPEKSVLWMAEPELRTVFAGKQIDGHYENGKVFQERYLANGRLEYSEAERRTGGRWSVQSGTFCTIYDTDPAGGCFRVHRVGSNCFEFYFVARTEDEAARPERRTPDWTARGWVSDQPSTCTEGANV